MKSVETGLSVLASEGFARLRGMKVGLVTNPTGILPDFTTTIEALRRAPGVGLAALFGPEHGVRGDVPAGQYVASSRDAESGVPVYSLYGATRVPTSAMLKGLDVLLFDLQDIGSRSYTYLATLGAVMEGAARHKIPLIVLDRPNPLGLERVEGGPTRPGFVSFVSPFPVAYRHGMTLGELARMINGKGWLPGNRTCDLTVVSCRNLSRASATWDAITGGALPWVPTSPHIPYAHTPHFYAATGITGELETLSIGVGYPLPFEMAGANGIGAVAFTREMNRRRLPGWTFRATNWTPFYGALKGKNCGGAQLYLTDPVRTPLCRLNFEILDALRVLDRGRSWFADAEATHLFDLDCGTDRIRKAFLSGANAGEMWRLFNEGADAFERERNPFLLYR